MPVWAAAAGAWAWGPQEGSQGDQVPLEKFTEGPETPHPPKTKTEVATRLKWWEKWLKDSSIVASPDFPAEVRFQVLLHYFII